MACGRVNKCKECNKKDVANNRKKNIDRIRKYDKERSMLPHRVEARKSYSKTDQGRESIKKSSKKWNDLNKIKKGASTMVGNAVRDGRLIKPSECSRCKNFSRMIHGHHDDYANPLSVRWLCPPCHKFWHDENGEGLNGG